MSGIYGREMRVVDWIRGAVDFDRPILVIDPMEQSAMFHSPFGMPGNDLPLKLQLHDRRSFLHARHHDFFAHPCAFDFKAGGGIFGIDRSYQPLERRNRDPIPFF